MHRLFEESEELTTIFRTYRRFPQAGGYRIPLLRGVYRVTFHVFEPWDMSERIRRGLRVFDVWLEGELRVERLDVAAEVGFAKPHRESVVVEVTDGALDIHFDIGIADYPVISGIEIERIHP